MPSCFQPRAAARTGRHALIDLSVFSPPTSSVWCCGRRHEPPDDALSTAILIISPCSHSSAIRIISRDVNPGKTHWGKMAMGLRSFPDDGGPEWLRQAAFRHWVGLRRDLDALRQPRGDLQFVVPERQANR